MQRLVPEGGTNRQFQAAPARPDVRNRASAFDYARKHVTPGMSATLRDYISDD